MRAWPLVVAGPWGISWDATAESSGSTCNVNSIIYIFGTLFTLFFLAIECVALYINLIACYIIYDVITLGYSVGEFFNSLVITDLW